MILRTMRGMIILRTIIFRLVISAFLCSSNISLAALTLVPNPVFGPSSLTYDSEQELVWLSPNVTRDISFNEVSNLLETDERFIGFRVASRNELELLFAHAGISDINVSGDFGLYGTQENVAGVQFLQSLVGTTYSVMIDGVNVTETAGFVGDSYVSQINGFKSANIGNIVIRENVITRNGASSFASAYSNWGSLPTGTQAVGVGTWLVSSVPEISMRSSFFLGLLMFFGIWTNSSKLNTRYNKYYY
jgi:hypothetical protein